MFDIACHLIGDQPIPNYLAIKEIPANLHILFATTQTKRVAERLQAELAEETHITHVSAFGLQDLEEKFAVLKEQVATKNYRIALNLTGGTKPMAIKLLQALESYENKEVFYIESFPNKQLLSFRTNEATDITTTIDDVKTFVSLHSTYNATPRTDYTPQEGEVAEVIWKLRNNKKEQKDFKKHLTKFANCLDKKDEAERKKEARSCWNAFLSEFYNHRAPIFDPNRLLEAFLEPKMASGYEDFICTYLGGGWFESLIYSRLAAHPEFQNGHYRDLQINTTLKGAASDIQEFDISFTDGTYLYIIECKSGRVTQEHVQTLKNLTTDYGGAFGRGILCSANFINDKGPINTTLRERFTSNLNRNIMLVSGFDIDRIVDAIQHWKRGIYVKQ